MSAEGAGEKIVLKEGAHVIAKMVESAGVRVCEQVGEDATKDAARTVAKQAAKDAAGDLDKNLISELERNGTKFSKDELVRIGRDADGKIVFLESGKESAGLQHILQRHAGDFEKAGIREEDIPDLVMDAVQHGDVVGAQGTRIPPRLIYQVEYQGRQVRVAVERSSNGFIVGANPRSMPK